MQTYLSPPFSSGNETAEDHLGVSFQPVDKASNVSPFDCSLGSYALSLRSAQDFAGQKGGQGIEYMR